MFEQLEFSWNKWLLYNYGKLTFNWVIWNKKYSSNPDFAWLDKLGSVFGVGGGWVEDMEFAGVLKNIK